MNNELMPAAIELLLCLGDDQMILGHRLSEWSGHGPILEEDIAITNIALDSISHSAYFLSLAGIKEGKGRDGDRLAYFRNATEFRNLLLVERPKGDFAFTIVRQFLYDLSLYPYYSLLATSTFPELAEIAEKAAKEVHYHLRHTREWVLRLGDGTEASHRRTQKAVEKVWPFTAELFEDPPWLPSLASAGVAPLFSTGRTAWESEVARVFQEAGLTVPTTTAKRSGGRRGKHSEHLDRLLTELQFLARSDPDANW